MFLTIGHEISLVKVKANMNEQRKDAIMYISFVETTGGIMFRTPYSAQVERAQDEITCALKTLRRELIRIEKREEGTVPQMLIPMQAAIDTAPAVRDDYPYETLRLLQSFLSEG